MNPSCAVMKFTLAQGLRLQERATLPGAVGLEGVFWGGQIETRYKKTAPTVQLFGETVPVRASIHTIGGLSAHAGQDGLMRWMAGITRKPDAVFIVHGEPEAAHALSARLAHERQWTATVARPQTPYDV